MNRPSATRWPRRSKLDGLRVITTADGREAPEQFRSEAPELVLLDLMLPQISGIEVWRIMRKESSVPIIMLTASEPRLGEDLRPAPR